MGKKSSSKEKHRKKHKKEKKSKKGKLKKRKYSSSSDSSTLDSDVDSKANIRQEKTKGSDWSFFETVMNEGNVLVKEKKEKKTRSSPERPGQNVRELNPYWKDGGCGLPPNKPEKSSRSPQPHSSSTFSSSWYQSETGRSSYNESSYEKPKYTFLKPSENSNIQGNKNTYQRNWKKKGFTEFRENTNVEEKKEEKPVSSSQSETYTNDELNTLAAKLVKAEIMNNIPLVNELKAKLEAAKKSKDQNSSENKQKEVVILREGGSKIVEDRRSGGRPSKRQKVITHSSGERVCYFPDDDKYSLKNLFEREKAGQEDDTILVSRLNVKNPVELDDAYLEAAAREKNHQKNQERKNQRSMKEAMVKHKTLEGCQWCLDNRNKTKHLVVSTGNKCYLSLPEEESLTTGHCIIVPIQHEISTVHLDEDVWEEIKAYQRALTKMFYEQEKDVIFFENARAFRHFPHCYIQCVPLDKEMGDMAPIYFQKAISESETEWSDNKKLIDFRHKDLRRSIPKGLPYFAVSFGNDGGFAHIIEDEQLFRRNFAEEVLGGMLDLDHKKWRKPQKDNFRSQREKTLEFFKMWRKYEFNENNLNSDSSTSD